MKRQLLLFFAAILPMIASADASGTCGEHLTWTYVEATHTLTISGEGSMANFNSSIAPWNSYSMTKAIIENGVTSIGVGAFWGCSSLTSITIPNSVTSIGRDAFQNCSGLTSVTIGNSVTTIGDNAFEYCSCLTSVTIGSSVTSIGNWAFCRCTGLASVTIPNSVTTIGISAFQGCNGLTSVTIGSSVTSIGDHAFMDCSGLTSITIPNSVTSIGSEAFRECRGLTSITIGSSVTSIGRLAFFQCSGLTSITIPNSVTSIEGSAFGGCSGLASVTIPNSLTSIGDNAFDYCSGLTSVTIPNSVTSIGIGAFYGCSGLTSLNLSDCLNLPSVTVNRNRYDGIFYGVSRNTLIYLPGGKGHSDGGGKNVIIGNKCTGGFALQEGQSFESPVGFEADEVSYDRTFTSGVTSTVCLPYTIAASNVLGGKFYSFGGVSDDFVVTMNEVTGDIQASTPYLFVPSSESIGFDGSVTVGIVNRDTSPLTKNGEWDFCGTYEKITWRTAEDFGDAVIYGFAANTYGEHVQAGDFVKVSPSNDSYINPFRAYLKFTAQQGGPGSRAVSKRVLPNKLKVVLVDSDDSTTAIRNVATDGRHDAWFSLDGKRLESMPTQKGVYVRNGKKIVK